MNLDVRRRTGCYISLCAILCILFIEPLKNLVVFALHHEYGSQILLAAPISTVIVFLRRDRIFSKVVWGIAPATVGFVTAAALNAIGLLLNSSGSLPLQTLVFLLFCASAFILCYGLHALRSALFPFAFVLFLVPIPEFLLEKVISFLQNGSAEVALRLFKLSGIPVMRDGLVFHIPSLDLEVARQCSGIRSSIVLLLTTVLVAEFSLRCLPARLALVFSVVPIVILKNAIRIVVISLLAVYVNRGFLHGWLHQSGGVVFYLLSLLVLIGLLRWLKVLETRPVGGALPASKQDTQ